MDGSPSTRSQIGINISAVAEAVVEPMLRPDLDGSKKTIEDNLPNLPPIIRSCRRGDYSARLCSETKVPMTNRNFRFECAGDTSRLPPFPVYSYKFSTAGVYPMASPFRLFIWPADFSLWGSLKSCGMKI